MPVSLSRKLLAEYLGSMVLVVAAIGPMILGYQALGSTIAVAVFMDAIAVAFVLFVLIEILGPVSDCHINPAVTIAMMASARMDYATGLWYILVQFLGGLSGTIVTHLMFFHENFFKLLTISEVQRSEGAYVGEFVGTFLLVLTIYGCMHKKSDRTALVVGLLVGGLLITTSSTMFANPQVTFARMFTFAVAGVRPLDGLVFIVVQILGGLTATFVAMHLFPDEPEDIRSHPGHPPGPASPEAPSA